MALALTGGTGTGGSSGSTTGGAGIVVTGGTQGDQNIAWMSVNGANLTFKSTWNIGDQYADANGSSVWVWMPNLGTSSSLVVDWGGSSQSWHAAPYAFSGADYIPYRAHNKAHGTATPLTVASLTTQNANSFVAANEMIFSSSQVIGVPPSYTNISAYNDAFGSNQTSYQTLGAAGSNSTAISSTITAANWNSHGIEIAALVPSTYPYPVQQLGFPSGTGTSATIVGFTLPAGDIAIAFCQVNIPGAIMTVSGAGWTILQQDTSNSLSIAIAANVAGGNVPAVTFNWGTSATYAAQAYQYRGAKGTFGTMTVTAGNSATAAAPGIATTAAGSLVLLWGFSTANNMFSQNPDYYVEVAFSNASTISYSFQDRRVAAPSTTPNYSQAFVGGVTQPWKMFMTEVIPAVAPPSGTDILMGQQLTW